MADPSIDVNRLVREVLDRLRVVPDASPKPGEPPPAGRAGPTTDGDLIVTARVVTADDVEGRLDGVRRLVVPLRAVLTPSVHDLLHRNGVTLVRAPGETAQAAQGVRLVVLTVGESFDPAGLIGVLASEGIRVDARTSDCLIASSDELAGELGKGSTLGLLLTSETAVALCLANRCAGVRAVRGTDAAAAAAAVDSVGANLLIVAPAKTSFFQLKLMVTEFCRGGIRHCPEVLRERLG